MSTIGWNNKDMKNFRDLVIKANDTQLLYAATDIENQLEYLEHRNDGPPGFWKTIICVGCEQEEYSGYMERFERGDKLIMLCRTCAQHHRVNTDEGEYYE